MAALQRRAVDLGRRPVSISLFGARPEPAAIEAYADVGVGRCLFVLPEERADTVLPVLDRLIDLVRTVGVP